MSYPRTGRGSFVADWSKQGDGEDSSQRGLAALLRLVTAHRCSRASCVLAAVTGVSHLWCWAGASGAVGEPGCCSGKRCWAPAVPRHGCQWGPTPRQGTPEVFWPAWWAPGPCGSCCQLRFGPSQQIQLPGGLSSPPDIWINPRLLRAGRLWVMEGGGMLGRGGRGVGGCSARYHIYSILSPR